MDAKLAAKKICFNPSLILVTIVGTIGATVPAMAQKPATPGGAVNPAVPTTIPAPSGAVPGGMAAPGANPGFSNSMPSSGINPGGVSGPNGVVAPGTPGVNGVGTPAPGANAPGVNNGINNNGINNNAVAPNRGGAPLQVDEGYLLGAGDRVKLDVFGVPEYSGEYQVLADGTINLPLAGNVSVQGMSMKQASKQLESKFGQWLTRPVITISLLSARPVQVAMSGEVTRPGTYTTNLAESGIPTLTKMVQLAGGITQSADIKDVQIQRRRPGSSGMQTLKVNLSQLLKSGDISQDIPLRDGDRVVIAASTTMNLEESNQLANSSFAASTDRPISIVVAGEVNRPGPHSVQGENIPQAAPGSPNQPNGVATKVKAPTVTRAIQVAGGITQRANLRDIEVKRSTRSGTEQTIKVNLMDLIKAGDARQDILLQEGDRIVIGTATNVSPEDAAALARASFSPDAIAVNVVGEVEKPGVIQVPPNTTMNQAILAAGGFNGKARKNSVEFIRLQANGSVERRRVGVDFTRGIDVQGNPQLQAYDTIVVGKSGLARFSDGVGNILSPFGALFGIRNIFR